MQSSNSSFVCLIGPGIGSEGEWVDWLEADSSRCLTCVSENEEALALMQERNPKIQCIRLDSFLQIEPIAKKLAKQAVFLETQIIQAGDATWFPSFRLFFEQSHRTMNALLSDGVDLGVFLAKQTLQLKKNIFRQGMALKNRFQGVPAVIVGAGGSLEGALPSLEKLEGNALFFVGGAALPRISFEPHFAASIDPIASHDQMKRFAFWETPFCVQNRTNPAHFPLFHGELLSFPESHFSFVNWLMDQESFDGGWTVANFMTSMALLLGCDPICFAGVDFCYRDGMKYGMLGVDSDAKLISVGDFLTQPDWLLSHGWMEKTAEHHPDRVFIDLTHQGLPFKKPIIQKNISDLHLHPQPFLRKRVHDAIGELPQLGLNPIKLQLWMEELKKASTACSRFLSYRGQEEFDEDGVVYDLLLEPLWRLWEPVFTRTAQTSSLQKVLFFQQVLEEHQAIYE
jgi:hypothetical protein